MFFKRNKKTTIDPANVPAHIGIIMDGNGRWAKKRGLPRSAGHRMGAETLKKIVVHANGLGVRCITAYAFSTENWNRPKAEVDALMELLYSYLGQVEKQFDGTNVRLRVIGDICVLSPKIQRAIDYAEDYTKDNTGLVLNIALNYGGRQEIVRAVRTAAAAVKNGSLAGEDITEDYLSSLMYTGDVPPLDLIIRPSGEKRLSNFLLWQSAYAELWFDEICWPDFSEKDLEKAIISYQGRDRRFGRV